MKANTSIDLKNRDIMKLEDSLRNLGEIITKVPRIGEIMPSSRTSYFLDPIYSMHFLPQRHGKGCIGSMGWRGYGIRNDSAILLAYVITRRVETIAAGSSQRTNRDLSTTLLGLERIK